MTDDIDDEFRQIVASQLADLDVESLDDLDFFYPSPESHDEPLAPRRNDPLAPPRDHPAPPPRDQPPPPTVDQPSVPPDPPVRPAPPAAPPSAPPLSWTAPPSAPPRSWTPPPERDDFVPPPPLPPAKRPSVVAWAAISSIASGVVLLAGVVLRVLDGSWATPVGFLMLCSGLVVLFTRLPRDRDPGPDNGAKV